MTTQFETGLCQLAKWMTQRNLAAAVDLLTADPGLQVQIVMAYEKYPDDNDPESKCREVPARWVNWYR